MLSDEKVERLDPDVNNLLRTIVKDPTGKDSIY